MNGPNPGYAMVSNALEIAKMKKSGIWDEFTAYHGISPTQAADFEIDLKEQIGFFEMAITASTNLF